MNLHNNAHHVTDTPDIPKKRGRQPLWVTDPVRHRCEVAGCQNTAQYEHSYRVCITHYVAGYKGDLDRALKRI